MAFPTSPSNNQIATVNNIQYQYNSTSNLWLRLVNPISVFTIANTVVIANTTTSISTSSGALQVSGGVGVGGNVYATGVYIGSGSATSGLFWAANNAAVSTGGGGSFTGGVVTSTIYPSGNLTLNLGTPTAYWGTTYTGQLTANTISVGSNLTVSGNTVHNSKTYFNFSGDEQQISLDTSIMRTGSWSVTSSGSLYTLVGEPIMWYWIHNCAIDPATGNFLARDDFGPVTVWALTESMLIKTWISPPDQTLSVPTSWTLTGNQDTNNGLFTTGGMSGNSLKLTQVATPAAASGTGSATGGSLAAGNYYVRVVGIDVNGQTTLPSAESTVVTTTGSTSSIAYIIPATVGVNSYRIYVTQTSGTYTSGYFTFSPDYLTNYFTLTTLSGTTAGSLPSINNTGGVNIAGNIIANGSPVPVLGQSIVSAMGWNLA